MIVVILEN